MVYLSLITVLIFSLIYRFIIKGNESFWHFGLSTLDLAFLVVCFLFFYFFFKIINRIIKKVRYKKGKVEDR